MKTMKILLMVLLYTVFFGCAQKEETEQEKVIKPIKVTVTSVKSEINNVVYKYSGTVEPSLTIPLTFRATGTVEKVLVEEGDYATKGQLLASVDKTDAQNMVDMTQSKFDQALDAYNRLKSVHEQGSLPEIKWVEMESGLEQAKTALELSKNNLNKCNMYAPVNGIIGSRNIEPGMSSLNIASAPLEIVEIKNVKIKISIPEKEIAKIKKGFDAIITVSALNDEQFQGEITNISPVADKISRTYEAKIEVSNPVMKLKPGMVCDVSLNIPSDEGLIVVPYQGVSEDNQGNSYVYLVDSSDKKANKQLVKIGNYFGDYIEIVAGLTEGQVIVSKGVSKLSDNCLITW